MREADEAVADEDISLGATLVGIASFGMRHRALLLLAPLFAGLVALAATFVLPQIFTAKTTILPPQQQQNSASVALNALGPLAGLASVGRTPSDQYVALLQSVTVMDRLIDRFDLMRVYDESLRVEARRELMRNVRISLGKKDGLISIEVDDESPQRAADLANWHVQELQALTSSLALTEAQQRRRFFQSQVETTKEALKKAELELQTSGFSAGALRAEPRAAAEGYARLKAETTAAEVRLQTLRQRLTETTPEVNQAVANLSALRGQLARLEVADEGAALPGYISKFREFRYQENLFELFSRQFEIARIDESREGALIQVIDTAQVPEKRSRPQRALVVAGAVLGALLAAVLGLVTANTWREALEDPKTAAKLREIRSRNQSAS